MRSRPVLMMMNRGALHLGGAAIFLAFTSAGPISAVAAEPVALQALERAWHICVRTAYDQQPEHASRAGRERNALDEGNSHEDCYVATLMAARPADDLPLNSWARTWATYVVFVVDPVKAWIEALRR